MKYRVLSFSILFAALLVSSPIFAHHGETNYDTDKLVSVKATVTDFQFINPHVQIFLDAKNDKGEVEKWTCEARSPAMLVRNGAGAVLLGRFFDLDYRDVGEHFRGT
jgi:hypothetical protein